MASTVTSPATLWDALALVPDHRRAKGKRYPLASLLLIAIAAMLSGRRDQLGIVRWGRQLSQGALASIGIERGRIPAPSVWCELFQQLDVIALEQAFGQRTGEQGANRGRTGRLAGDGDARRIAAKAGDILQKLAV